MKSDADAMGRILVLGEDHAQAEGISAALAASGRASILANDTADAISRFEERRPELVILHVDTDVSSALEMMLYARAHTEVPFVLVGGEVSTVVRVQWLELGAIDYVTRPVSMLELVARAGAHLRVRAAAPTTCLPEYADAV